MSLVIKQIKVYARLIVLVTLVLIVAIVVAKNSDNRVTVWFFHSFKSINVLWLILITAVAAVVAWKILMATRGLWRDMRELHRENEMDKSRRDQSIRERELAETEKRIDKKIKKAIGDDEDSIE